MEKQKQIRVSERQLMDAYRSEVTKFEMLQQRQRNLQQALAEILTAREAVKELHKAKKDESVLVSLGAGVYAEAKAGAVRGVKTSLPGNVLIDTDSEKAGKKLGEERQKVEKALVAAEQEKQAVVRNIKNFERLFTQIRQRAAEQARSGKEGEQGNAARSVS